MKPHETATPVIRRSRRRRAGAGSAALLGLVIAMLAGCADRQRLYDDISARRATSYRSWLGKHTGDAESVDVVREKLSLDECISIAMVNNKQIAAAGFDKLNARGKITESYSAALPSIDINGVYTRLDESPSIDFEGTSISLGSANIYDLGATLNQPLYRGGRIGAGIRAARLYGCISEESFEEVVQGVIFAVRKTYYDVLLAQELLRVSEEAVALSQQHVVDVKNRKQQGASSDYDVLRAQVEVSNYEAEMIQNRNRLHLLKTSFYKLLGISQESEVEFVGSLEHKRLEPSLEEAVQEAFMSRHDLIRAALEHRLYKENVIATKAERRPKLDLFFEENYSRPDPHNSTRIAWGDAWTAGAVMSFPLFDGFRIDGRVRQAKADLAKSRVQLADTEDTALLEVKQAILSIQDAESFIRSQQENVRRASEGLKLAEAAYREGVTTDLEVRDARQALLRARSLHYQAIHQHEVAALGLEKATGSLRPSDSAFPGGTPENPGPSTSKQRKPPSSE